MKEYKQFRNTNYYVEVNEGKLYHMVVNEENVKVFTEVKPRVKQKGSEWKDRVDIGKTLKIHRVVFEACYGFCPPSDMVVHHINGDHHDNRPENLALMTVEEHRNMHKKGDD